MATYAQSEAARPFPTGTVTFLFSDIEGSTERWERDREVMADALRRHDALVREAIEVNSGHVFKTVGDAFCAVFARPEDAIRAALDAQRAIGAGDFSAVDGLRVRMAVHTGTADERDGDYFGPAVNRVARLLAIGHGGQVLVSGTATELLQGAMPRQATLRDLGAHRLKDLARPEQVYQLIGPGLSETFPPLRSLGELPNNLPLQLTSFVGRDRDVAEIANLVRENRLVTLVGAGGCGKTRCAVQVGAELLDGSGDGVWVVELAPLSDPSLVKAAAAQTLGVTESPNHPLLDTILTYLKKKRLLLILDNCEHVIDEARAFVAAIVRTCPDVRILATSREGLGVAGERVYRLPSLAVPRAGDALPLREFSQFGAIALFADRALASDARFVLDEDNVPSVAEICRRLDGIPLAIELAAARVKVLAPRQLAQKLDERFQLLTGGDRTALPRQQTMRALIDWSYNLLTDDERLLFRRLSIFAGGFGFESATALCTMLAEQIGAAPSIEEYEVLDHVSSLVDKSLVQAELHEGETRYGLLESSRQYAREKLIAAGEHAAVARAHALVLCELAERMERVWETTPDRAWFAKAEPEFENWRAALEWSLAQRNDILLGQRLAAALRWMWYRFTSEGRGWIAAALETAGETTAPVILAKLEITNSMLESAQAHFKGAVAGAERAIAYAREVGDPLLIAEAQVRFANALLISHQRRAEAAEVLRAALPSVRPRTAPKTHGFLLRCLAVERVFSGDMGQGRARFAEALTVLRTAGSERGTVEAAIGLAESEFLAGDPVRAVEVAAAALAGMDPHDLYRRVFLVNNMAAYLVALERYDDAERYGREALSIARDIQHDVMTNVALGHLASAGASRAARISGGDDSLERAARLVGYVDAGYESLEAPVQATEARSREATLAVLEPRLGAEKVQRLIEEGRTWTQEHAFAEAMLL